MYTYVVIQQLDCLGWGVLLICITRLQITNIFIDLPSSRLANQKWLKNIWATTKSGCVTFCITQLKTNNNPNLNRLWAQGSKTFFDSDESKYELWEVKCLGYLRIQHLHQIILSPIDQNFVEKNATAFSKLIQYLDDKSLSSVIRDTRDNGR